MSGSISDFISNNPNAGYISQTETGYNIPSGLLGALGYAESTLGANDTGGNAGGWGQFIQSTWNSVGGGDIMDDQQNITNSGAYLSQLYGQTGSWVTALQRYGTLPSNLNGLNPAQSNVLSLAQQADAGGGGSQTSASFVDPETGAVVNTGQLGGGNPLYNAGGAAGNAAAPAITTIANDFTAVLTWFKSLNPSDLLLAVAIVIIAILMLIFGIGDLVFGKSAKEVIQVAGSTIKSGVE